MISPFMLLTEEALRSTFDIELTWYLYAIIFFDSAAIICLKNEEHKFIVFSKIMD